MQRHQSLERPILRQISCFMYPKIQRRQVIINVLHPGCLRSPRWLPAILWRRFKDGLASICIHIHSCKMPTESGTTGHNEIDIQRIAAVDIRWHDFVRNAEVWSCSYPKIMTSTSVTQDSALLIMSWHCTCVSTGPVNYSA